MSEWAIQDIEAVLDLFAREQKVKHFNDDIDRWRHIPLHALGLKGKKRLVADCAALTTDGNKVIYIEVDSAGAAAHSVLKYFPQLETLDSAKQIFLLHVFGKGFLQGNLESHVKLAGFIAEKIKKCSSSRFHYQPSQAFEKHDKDGVTNWVTKEIKGILERP